MSAKGVARKGDKDAVHCGGVNPIREQCAKTVFTNGRGTVRLGDKNNPHPAPNPNPPPECITHTAEIVVASKTVFAEGKGVARIGDPVGNGTNGVSDCTVVETGSTDTFAGG